ncbi:MAG: diacylglycerol kinase family lipid kinase [Sphaerochaetaceae bacterium]|nr:diacylglycerol kinase family lipid kinase [Sphaerochaetaceae bacterium]
MSKANKKCLFIYNPVSGKGLIESKIDEITKTIRSYGYETTSYATTGTKDDYEFLSEENLNNYNLVICSGGDGTLNRVAGFLTKNNIKTPFGYIPAGSTNDFAHSLGLEKNVTKAIERILSSSKTIQIDTGLLNEKPFFYVAAFGAITRITYTTPQSIKKKLGYLAYVIYAIKDLFPLKEYRIEVKSEEREFEEKVVAAVFSNSHYVGGFKVVNDRFTSLTDGYLEALFIRKPRTIFGLIPLALSLASHKYNKRYMVSFQSRELTVVNKGEHEIAWNIDGENGGAHKSATIKICPGTLNIKA